MSQIQDKVHLYLKAIANGARDRAAASSRNLDRRLKRTRLTLASLHVSEKHERTALATAIKARSAAAQAGGTLKRAEAAGDLEIDTHRSNLTAIERQIQLVGYGRAIP